MSNNGVLFLDELPEFKRSVLEVMSQPVEERWVAKGSAEIRVEHLAEAIQYRSLDREGWAG